MTPSPTPWRPWKRSRARPASSSISAPETNWISAEDTYGKGDYVKGGSKGAKGRSLKDFAAVVFYTNGETEMTDQQKEDLLAYIRSGKGFVRHPYRGRHYV